MTKEKVLLIAANDMGNSGVPNVFMQIVRNLSEYYVFDIVITRENYYYRDEFLSYGGKIFLIKEREYENKLKRIWWRLFGLKRDTRRHLNKILNDSVYKIIHSFKEGDSYMYLKPAKRHKIAARIVHNNRKRENPDSFIGKTYLNYSIKKTLKYSTKNISVSNASGLTFFGNHSFATIYNSYNERKYKFTKYDSDGGLNLLQIGTFLPIKNQLFTLDVMKEIVLEIPNAKCTFIGRIFDRKYYEKFTEQVEKLGLANNVIALDSDVDQLPIMERTTFSLMPSLAEGLSLTAIESQAVGITVFASNNLPKEVDVGNIIFEDLDSSRWAKLIIDEYRKNKGARKKVNCEKFSVKCFKDKIYKIYTA